MPGFAEMKQIIWKIQSDFCYSILIIVNFCTYMRNADVVFQKSEMLIKVSFVSFRLFHN